MQPQQVMPQQPPVPPPVARGTVASAVGVLLLLPAVVLTVLTLVIPTVGTIGTSMRAENFLSDDAEYVGFDNYSALFGDTSWWSSVGFALSLVVVPIVVAVVVAPLVAAALSWAGGWARLTGRIALGLTLVVFSPVALAIAWQRDYRDDPTRIGDPELAGGVVRGAVGMMTFGVVCAVGVMIFLPVFRAREQRRPMWPALFATAGVAVLGLLAIGLQLFTIPLAMTNFGPEDKTLTPVGVLFETGFQQLRVGMGAAAATVLLVLLAILGVAAVLIVVLTRLRVSLLPLRKAPPAAAGAPFGGPAGGAGLASAEFGSTWAGSVPPGGPGETAPLPFGGTPAEPAPPGGPAGTVSMGAPPPFGGAYSTPPTPRRNVGAIVLAVLVLVAVVVATVLNMLPWFDALSGSEPPTPSGAQGRTWGPALLAALVSVGVAYLAALGISGLRPLGRHSEWLLMPFAPWLFVGVAALSIDFFSSAREAGDLDTEGVSRPPVLVSILALVILAVLCRGQSERWRHEVAAGAPEGPAFLRTVLVPTLPLAGFLFVVATLFNAQDLLWPLLVTASQENATVPLTLLMANGDLTVADFSVASATPLLAVVLCGLAVVSAQALHLDRMVAATGRSD
jgi:ABC-type sugar transport system permease subunit